MLVQLASQEALQRARQRLGLVVVQHVAAGRQLRLRTQRHHRQPVRRTRCACSGLAPPLSNVGEVAFDPQQRRADQLPGLEVLVTRYSTGLTRLCAGSPRMCQRPSSPRRDQCGASQAALSARQQRVVLHQPRGHLVQAGVAAQRLRRASARPAIGAAASARPAGCVCGHAEAFEVDEPADALRAHAGVAHDHVAAHAVAEQVDRRSRGDRCVEQRVEVAQVVGEPVAVGAAWRRSGRSRASPAAMTQRRSARLRQRIDRRTGTTRPRPSSRAAAPGRARGRGQPGSPQTLRWCFRPRSSTKRLRAGRRGT